MNSPQRSSLRNRTKKNPRTVLNNQPRSFIEMECVESVLLLVNLLLNFHVKTGLNI